MVDQYDTRTEKQILQDALSAALHRAREAERESAILRELLWLAEGWILPEHRETYRKDKEDAARHIAKENAT